MRRRHVAGGAADGVAVRRGLLPAREPQSARLSATHSSPLRTGSSSPRALFTDSALRVLRVLSAHAGRPREAWAEAQDPSCMPGHWAPSPDVT